MKTLYKGFHIKIQNNGKFTSKINVTRSVHQGGGPNSNALFLAVAELIVVNLWNDGEIKGIFVKNILNLLNQFADDMDIFSEFSQSSFNRILYQLDQFRNNTGFQLSYKKTTVYRIGSLQNTNAKLYCEKDLNWTSKKIKVLGIEVTADDNKTVEMNYDPVIDKAEKILSSWSTQTISLFGKITVINTLVASLFVYKLSVLPMMSQKQINRLQSILKQYLWNGHRAKIPLKCLMSRREDGGAGLVDFEAKNISLKCGWIQMLAQNAYPKELAYESIQPEIKDL